MVTQKSLAQGRLGSHSNVFITVKWETAIRTAGLPRPNLSTRKSEEIHHCHWVRTLLWNNSPRWQPQQTPGQNTFDIIIYTWCLDIHFLGFWGEGRIGEFLNHLKGHDMLKGSIKILKKIMQLWWDSEGHAMVVRGRVWLLGNDLKEIIQQQQFYLPLK